MTADPGDSMFGPARLPAPGEVDLHACDFQAGGEDLLSAHWPLLSPDERERAVRYRHVGDSKRFVERRGWLRLLLASYLHCPPARVEFRRSAGGRPALAGEAAASGLTFNTSMSGSVAVVAFGVDRMLGVDVETPVRFAQCLHLQPVLRAVAAAQAGPSTAASLSDLEKWVCLEAVLKALGTGFSRPLPRLLVAAEGEDWTATVLSAVGRQELRLRVINLPQATVCVASDRPLPQLRLADGGPSDVGSAPAAPHRLSHDIALPRGTPANIRICRKLGEVAAAPL